MKRKEGIDIQEVDQRLQGLRERLDGVQGEVLRCVDEQAHTGVREQQKAATRDYFKFFFGENVDGSNGRKHRRKY
ncbi:MAG: hypothetical protein OEZ10_03870 [Gammaproteobacteria bacterium]|nr:hypothetical protein [Gammaproteobacteria bacterium]